MLRLLFTKKYFLFSAILFFIANFLHAQQTIDSTAFEEGIEDSLEEEADSIFEMQISEKHFQLDTLAIPGKNIYNRWDSSVIDPYREDLIMNPDTVKLVIADKYDCMFVPPCMSSITSGFGYRRWGRRYLKFHYGVDFGMPVGEPVYAAFDGVVRIATYSTSYGFVAVIRHYNGFETLYGHFSKLLVATGQSVRAGDMIGLAGSTGHSTGSHLHFEMRYKGKPIDPGRIISLDKRCLLSDTVRLNADYFAHLKLAKAMFLSGRKWKQFTPSYSRKAKYYKIKKRETIYTVAYRNHTTVARLCKLNHIRANTKLKVGRVLRVA